MAKPICIVYIPFDIGVSGGRQMNWEDCNELTEIQLKAKPDYHWFFLLDSTAEKIDFKVFYEKDFTEIQYAELKKIIEDSIQQKQQ